MLKNRIKQIIGKPYYAWEKFHQKTKRKSIAPFPDPSQWPESWTTTYFKEYPRLDQVILPEPTGLKNTLLEEAVLARKSERRFSKTALSLEQLSNFLFFSCGLRDNKPPWTRNRTYPSPGARYPLEVYALSLNSELPLGLYHYNLKSHSVEILLKLDSFDCSSFFNQDWIQKAAIVILVSGIFERNTIKYGELGYRHVLEEAGHMGQNFYLVATALNLNVCAIGGYVDEKLNQLLDIDGIKETVIYALAFGNNPK